MLCKNIADANLVIYPPGPRKYTFADWEFNNRQKNRVSEDQQQLAGRVLQECDRLIDETKQTTSRNKEETDYRLKERILDVEFRWNELKIQKRTAQKEEEALKLYRQRILIAIDSLREQAARLCSQCIIFRENRKGIDMVIDDVDLELRKEMEVITGCQQLLTKSLEECSEVIRTLRACMYLIDRDCANKEKSLSIDNQNLLLRENQMEMSVYEGSTPLDPYSTTGPEWDVVTNQTIENTAKELNSAKNIRSFIDILLNQIVEDLNNQVDRTNEAFTKRISETRYTKNKLEGIHNETANQINNIARTINRLEKELAEKEGYLALVQMRLANRAQRPGVELCKDAAQDQLMKELYILRETVGKLNQMLAQAKATQRYLLNTEMQQIEEINIKTNTLKIDEVDCQTVRQSLCFRNF